jgi:hypothetical protein
MYPINPTLKKEHATTEIAPFQDCVVPVVSPHAFSCGLFTFSPFGLGCQMCEKPVTIQLNLRSIQIHLKKHGMESRISTAKSLLESFEAQLETAKQYCTIEPYRVDDITYKGLSCVCGKVFQLRKDSALRHCRKGGCDPTKLQKVDLFKLCCGSYVSSSQIDSLFVPHITKQFNYAEARATLLSFLPNREKDDHTYTHMFTPLITQCGGSVQFAQKIEKDFAHIHSNPSPTHEPLLIPIHKEAETWLLKFAQKNILMVPGNLRAALQTFEGGEVDDISQRSVYTMQHDPATLLIELKKLLSFAYRRGFFSDKPFNSNERICDCIFLEGSDA